MSEIIWYLSFCVWLISLSVMFSRSIHIVNMPKFHILLYSNGPLYVYPFIHSSVDRHLGCCFHLLTIVNNAAVNTSVSLCFQFFAVLYPEVKLLNHMVTRLNFLKNHHTVFHSGPPPYPHTEVKMTFWNVVNYITSLVNQPHSMPPIPVREKPKTSQRPASTAPHHWFSPLLPQHCAKNASFKHSIYACVLSHFSHIQFHNPLDRNLLGSSDRILQARILVWVATPSSRGSSNPEIEPTSLVSCIGRQVLYH